MSIHDTVREAGSQGAEIILWLIARAALGEQAHKVHASYHVPISNTAAGVMAVTPG